MGESAGSHGLSEGSFVVAVPGQASCDLDGQAVILHLGSGLYHGLNEVGSRVWSLVQGEPIQVGAIREALVAEFEIDPETCLHDLLAVLEEMRSAELIEVRDAEAA